MYSYPLRFDVGSWTTTDHLRVRDAEKQPVMYGAPPHDNQPYTLRVSNKDPRILGQIRKGDDEAQVSYVITDADEAPLGTLVEVKGGQWSILDDRGAAVGSIRLKNGWRKSFLYELLTPASPSLLDNLLVLLAPLVYDLEWRGRPVLRLREKDWEVVSHTYQLTRQGDLVGADELLLLASLVAVFWGE